ncbi:MAG: CHAD domain-containing protein [Thiobacillus sp.]|nr:CHAD domain-containing protein [Thiobacillus sp.]
MTVSYPVEVELKLALPRQQATAFLRLMARRRSVPVRHAMRTLYFDTPDFALSALGVALRVRRIGRRWLQTIKTEGERHGGLSQRAEFEMPVTRGMPDWNRFPAEALALVPEALRAQLEPVFETRFERTAWLIGGDGGASIEVALDVGEVHAGARRLPICEIELELKSGQQDALFELAHGWAQRLDCLPFDVSKAERVVRLARGQVVVPFKSVPLTLDSGMSVEAGFAAIVQACLDQFQANLPGVLSPLPSPPPGAGEGAKAGPKPIDDIEYVHQARVSLRRLRAALRLYRKVCVLPAGLMDGLRSLAAALGPARDWDVLCGETLPAIAPHYQNEAGWQQGAAVLEAHRVEVRAAMQAALRLARPGAWLLAFQRWLLQRGWRMSPSGGTVSEAQRFTQLSPLKKWARGSLQKGHRPIARGARVFAGLQPLQRHALRIAIKRQRYAAEFFQTLLAGRRQAQYLDMLREAQDSLGRSNDARVAWELLKNAPVDTGPVGQFALGWLAAQQVQGPTEDIAGHLQGFVKFAPYW